MAESLTDYLDGKTATQFERRPYYCRDGGFLAYYASGEEAYAEQVDEFLTVYRSIDTDAVVGCKVFTNHVVPKLTVIQP